MQRAWRWVSSLQQQPLPAVLPPYSSPASYTSRIEGRKLNKSSVNFPDRQSCDVKGFCVPRSPAFFGLTEGRVLLLFLPRLPTGRRNSVSTNRHERQPSACCRSWSRQVFCCPVSLLLLLCRSRPIPLQPMTTRRSMPATLFPYPQSSFVPARSAT